MNFPENIRLRGDGGAVIILDQTLLPNEEKYLELTSAEEMHEAIYSLRVRGAPAIGVFAAYALYVLAMGIRAEGFSEFFTELKRFSDYLASSRPTAVNLGAMLGRMEACAQNHAEKPVPAVLDALKNEALSIRQEDMEMCLRISENALTLVKDGDGILTHCNAGPLATSRYGTGQGAFFLGRERGIHLKAYCDETRPLLQGARLTSWELTRAGVDCTLVCDNMAASLMSAGKIQACFVGCDRVAANGDTANKIGTCGLAILARYFKIPFYVLGPSTTIDPNCPTGRDIPIELRGADEIKTKFFEKPVAPPEVKCWNPAFDVTPHELITAIITEHGVCREPYTESLMETA